MKSIDRVRLFIEIRKDRLKGVSQHCNKAVEERREIIFSKQRREGIDKIPVFIISFNRLSYLKLLVERLEKSAISNIIIIDNASTYIPLIEYYETIPYKVIRMDKNYGQNVFFERPEFDEYRHSFYVLSDPDVVPVEECPDDFIEHFFDLLEIFPNIRKVGFSLKIDDLPADGVFTKQALKWEKQFRRHSLKKYNAHLAHIDTTFALYIPDELITVGTFYAAIRTDGPYEARHLPWYKKRDDVTEEDIFYSKQKKNGINHWDV